MPESDDIPLTSCSWSAPELRDQTVEFRLSYPSAFSDELQKLRDRYTGRGRFVVIRERAGLIGLAIDVMTGSYNSPTYRRLPLRQRQVDRIERHPDQSVAVYRLFDDVVPKVLDQLPPERQ